MSIHNLKYISLRPFAKVFCPLHYVSVLSTPLCRLIGCLYVADSPSYYMVGLQAEAI